MNYYDRWKNKSSEVGGDREKCSVVHQVTSRKIRHSVAIRNNSILQQQLRKAQSTIDAQTLRIQDNCATIDRLERALQQIESNGRRVATAKSDVSLESIDNIDDVKSSHSTLATHNFATQHDVV